MGAGYGSAGERCMAISVAVPVGKETGDALVAKLKPRVERMALRVYRRYRWRATSELDVAMRDALERLGGSGA